jgi:hypothetical protein
MEPGVVLHSEFFEDDSSSRIEQGPVSLSRPVNAMLIMSDGRVGLVFAYEVDRGSRAAKIRRPFFSMCVYSKRGTGFLVRFRRNS